MPFPYPKIIVVGTRHCRFLIVPSRGGHGNAVLGLSLLGLIVTGISMTGLLPNTNRRTAKQSDGEAAE